MSQTGQMMKEGNSLFMVNTRRRNKEHTWCIRLR